MADLLSLLTDESKQKIVRLFDLQRRLDMLNKVIEANDPNRDEVSRLLDMFQNAGMKKEEPSNEDRTISTSFLYTWKRELEAEVGALTDEVVYMVNLLGAKMWIEESIKRYIPEHQHAIAKRLVDEFIKDTNIKDDAIYKGEGLKMVLTDFSKYLVSSLGTLLNFYEQELKNGSTKPPEG